MPRKTKKNSASLSPRSALGIGIALFLIGVICLDQVTGIQLLKMGQWKAQVNGNTLTLDPDAYAAGTVFPPNGISSDWRNSAEVTIYSSSAVTTEARNYLMATFPNFEVQTTRTSRDMEVDTNTSDGYVFLRYDKAGDKAIYFRLSNYLPNGYLDIGIATGITDGAFYPAHLYSLYTNDNIAAIAPGFEKSKNEMTNNYFTFGVEGMDIYVKHNGVEFLRFKEYRAMASGVAAFKSNQSGFRKMTVRFLQEKQLFSNYRNNSYDVRDFGLKSLQGAGSMAAGSNQLILSNNPGFSVGDKVIVEIGGEAGGGLRGTVGVGGSWPSLSYPNAAAMRADRNQAPDTYAWLQQGEGGADTNGDVYQFFEGSWVLLSDYNYYTKKVYPLSLVGWVTAIAPDGRTLTLDRMAKVSTSNASVYFDNVRPIQRIIRPTNYDGEANWSPRDGVTSGIGSSGFADITPTGTTVTIPAGRYAISQMVTMGTHNGWNLNGVGSDQTIIFSPKGVVSATVQISYGDNMSLGNMTVEGNARDQGFGMNVSETLIDRRNFAPPTISMVFATNSEIHDVITRNGFQGVSTGFSEHIRVNNAKYFLTDGMRTYAGWAMFSTDNYDVLFKNCSVESPKLIAGFEGFKSQKVVFEDCKSVNGTVSMNVVEDWVLRNFDFRLTTGSNDDNPAFSKFNPIVNINSNVADQNGNTGNIGGNGLIENIKIVQEGYINKPGDPVQDSLMGINISKTSPNITVKGGISMGPPFMPGATVHGPVGVNSTGQNTIVDGFRTIGRTRGWPAGYAGINVVYGQMKDCISGYADMVGWPPSAGAAFTVQNCWTNDTPPRIITDLKATAQPSSVKLTWTAPGGWANLRTASSYDIRYSTSAITEANFAQALQVQNDPTPNGVNTVENFTITGLTPGTKYCFAIKATNDQNATSLISQGANANDLCATPGSGAAPSSSSSSSPASQPSSSSSRSSSSSSAGSIPQNQPGGSSSSSTSGNAASSSSSSTAVANNQQQSNSSASVYANYPATPSSAVSFPALNGSSSSKRIRQIVLNATQSSSSSAAQSAAAVESYSSAPATSAPGTSVSSDTGSTHAGPTSTETPTVTNTPSVVIRSYRSLLCYFPKFISFSFQWLTGLLHVNSYLSPFAPSC